MIMMNGTLLMIPRSFHLPLLLVYLAHLLSLGFDSNLLMEASCLCLDMCEECLIFLLREVVNHGFTAWNYFLTFYDFWTNPFSVGVIWSQFLFQPLLHLTLNHKQISRRKERRKREREKNRKEKKRRGGGKRRKKKRRKGKYWRRS